MKEVFKHGKLAIVLVFASVILTGCLSTLVKEKLQWADDRVGEAFDEFGVATTTPSGTSTKFKLPDINLKNVKETISSLKDRLMGDATTTIPVIDKEKLDAAIVDAKDLTREAKEAVDTWLTLNGFNRYGDPIGTYYTGGTPLFDEITGAARDRFEYILDVQPDIISKALDSL